MVDMEGKTGAPQTPGDLERAEQDEMIAARLQRIKRKILVMSGKGGVGKSTVAAYIALLAALNGSRIGLLDVDLHGPSIPRMLDVRDGIRVSETGRVSPAAGARNLAVVSMEMLMKDKDTAVVWRGPMKISAIRQFVSDIDWGELDFLIVDSPPGTGDEPLTVAQIIPDAEALVVTTPQEVSLADVRKSITFCREVGVRILGLVENMGPFACPHCGQSLALFGEGGGRRVSEQMAVPFLGTIPMDPRMVREADRGGLPDLVTRGDLEIHAAYDTILKNIAAGR